jgi:3-methyl-2-oxobutanoate hydroxymethyltransferase
LHVTVQEDRTIARVTAASLKDRKKDGATSPHDKIAVLTAYDYPSAQILDEAGVDIILVGDSCGMVVMGNPDTLSVTMDDMVRHTRMVSRAVHNALVVADMPFLSYQISPEEALRNAGRLISEGGAHGVKLEGSVEKFGDSIAAIIRAGIPVMGHIGLTPQSINQIGGYKVQGRSPECRIRLKDEAQGLDRIGCFSLVLECIPADLAAEITSLVSIPTIGIGAGAACDGQVLVLHDILGWGATKFSKTFGDVRSLMAQACRAYVEEVRSGAFPDADRAFK